MSLPPLNPDKSTAGIVLDPTTLERVVPSSRRKDGTTRKELKIRPGFTPQEDVGRFRGTRQSAADAHVGLVPGSNRPAPPKQPNPDNPFASAPAEKSKAQLKNEKRRANKRATAAGAETSKAWDEMDSSDEELVGAGPTAGAAAEAEGGGGAPIPQLTAPTPPDPSSPLTLTDAALRAPPPISPHGDISGPASAAYPSKETEKAWKAASPPKSSTGGPPPPPSGTTPASRPARSSAPKRTPSASDTKAADGKAKTGRPHPIQGGRQGPLGLAHPPPPKNSPADFPALGGGKKTEKKSEEPRVRKDVKVREGGANDMSSLSARLRGMVIANAAQESPRQRRERVASEASKDGEGAKA